MNSFAIASFCGIALAFFVYANETTEFKCTAKPYERKNGSETARVCQYVCPETEKTEGLPIYLRGRGPWKNGTKCWLNDDGSRIGVCCQGKCVNETTADCS
uniref:Putative secreted protein n=1 Tax=Amblyomma americanum TaxID=6943 RepID=A0A0C9RVR8_AMBAM